MPSDSKAAGIAGVAGWWWTWWLETRGVWAGVVVPLAVTGLVWMVDPRGIPLGLAGGVLLGLLWGLGRAGRVAAVIAGVLVLPWVALRAAAEMFGGVVLILMLFAGILILIVGGGAFLLIKLATPRPQEPHYKAHWAEPHEVVDMLPPEAADGSGRTGDGIMLGTYLGKPLMAQPGLEGRREIGSGLVVGPSRSGKGLNLIANLISWSGSAIVLDVKGELYRYTAYVRSESALNNAVYVLDPSGRGSRYDPFAELGYSEEAMKRAVHLLLETDKARDPIFARRAASAVYAGLVGAQIEGAPSLAYLRETTAEGPRAYVERLLELGDTGIRRNLVDFLGGPPEEMEPQDYRNDRFLSSAWGTITSQLGAVFSEGILKMTGGSDFYAADLVKRPSTLYLMFAESDLDYTQKIFQVVMLALTTGLIRGADADPDADPVPMLLALDEAGRTPIPRLDDMVSTVAGRGVTTWIYIQDLAQLEGAYGREAARTIQGNCHTQVYYRPQDQTTAEHVSRMCGQMTVEDHRNSSSPGHLGHSESVGQKSRELATADEVRQMPDDEVIVFASRKPPIRADRMVWFEFFEDADDIENVYRPSEPPDLEMPDLSTDGSTDGVAGTKAGVKEEPRAAGSEPCGDGDGPRRRRDRRREKGEERDSGGYIEPDL